MFLAGLLPCFNTQGLLPANTPVKFLMIYLSNTSAIKPQLNSSMDKQPKLDQSNVSTIGHICIRDPDTGEVILHQRDITVEKKPEND